MIAKEADEKRILLGVARLVVLFFPLMSSWHFFAICVIAKFKAQN